MVLRLILALIISTPVLALTNGLPYLQSSDLIRIEINGRETVCSGFFVNSKTVITAAHCLRGKDLKQITLSSALGPVKTYLDKIITHPTLDIGIIKTSDYIHFAGQFPLYNEHLPRSGELQLLGAGKIDVTKKLYGFSTGKNSYYRFYTQLYILGSSRNEGTAGLNVSVAPNDSGAPMLVNNKVIAIASKSSVSWTYGMIVPALSIGLLVTDKEVADFLKLHL